MKCDNAATKNKGRIGPLWSPQCYDSDAVMIVSIEYGVSDWDEFVLCEDCCEVAQKDAIERGYGFGYRRFRV